MLGAKAHDIRSRRNRPRTGNSLEHERCGKGVQKSARRSERLIWCYLSLLTAGLRFLNACFHIWWRREVNKKKQAELSVVRVQNYGEARRHAAVAFGGKR